MIEVTAVPVGPVTVSLISADDRVVDHERRGGFEPDSLEAWTRLCAGGGRVLDIGAYTGIYAISAALLGCKVTAFEPLPAVRARLERNCALNNVDVDIRAEAVSDHDKAKMLFFHHSEFGNRLTSGASLHRRPVHNMGVTVPTLFLDSLGITELRAIKIDAEKLEPEILRGAVETIARTRPAIICESLTREAEASIIAATPGYRIRANLDSRNLLMTWAGGG